MSQENIIIIGIIVFAALYLIWLYNRIVSYKNNAIEGWSNVIATERQKAKILPDLIELTQNYQAHEQATLDNVTKLRTAVAKMKKEDVDVSGLGMIEQVSKELVGSISMVAEAYPDLKASETYITTMKSVERQNEMVGAAIRVFNSNVNNFNSLIQSFPALLVNKLLNREKNLNTFEDNESSKAFEFKPNL
ncbi:LemA family protein [Thiomicrorhabdus sp. 6S2-11]|uniref:LemA family protein n=1 Tax=Thiomicrorhabdus marina TaxID=2818442 RepID=A0ABS3Q2J5_9GAMM|nr:LemA family protein [Thiomicrorhabdus marina]MBO1926561.1 LemA family protein [Thiomicrorhabdus marina]